MDLLDTNEMFGNQKKNPNVYYEAMELFYSDFSFFPTPFSPQTCVHHTCLLSLVTVKAGCRPVSFHPGLRFDSDSSEVLGFERTNFAVITTDI